MDIVKVSGVSHPCNLVYGIVISPCFRLREISISFCTIGGILYEVTGGFSERLYVI